MKNTYKLFIYFGLICMCSCNFNREIQEDKYNTLAFNNLLQNFNDTLYYPMEDIMVTRLELIITGNIKKEGMLEIENGAGRFNKMLLKGEIEEKYEVEWYENKCAIRYIALDPTKEDYLLIKYQMR